MLTPEGVRAKSRVWTSELSFPAPQPLGLVQGKKNRGNLIPIGGKKWEIAAPGHDFLTMQAVAWPGLWEFAPISRPEIDCGQFRVSIDISYTEYRSCSLRLLLHGPAPVPTHNNTDNNTDPSTHAG